MTPPRHAAPKGSRPARPGHGWRRPPPRHSAGSRGAQRRRRRAGARIPLARTLGPFAKPNLPIIAAAGALVLVGTGLRLLRPWPLKYLFDDVLIPDTASASVQGALLVVVGALVAIAVLDNAVGFARTNLLNLAGQRVASGLRSALFRQIQRLSLTFHDRQRTGDLLTRVTKDVDKVQELLTGYVIDGASNALTLAGMLGVMLFLDWQLSAAMVLLVPVLLAASRRYQRRVRRVEQSVRQSEGDIASVAQETISAVRLVKAFGREAHESDRFDGHVRRSEGANLTATRTETAYAACIDLLTTAALAGLVWFGAQRVLSGELSPGDLLVFITYIRDFYGPTRSLSKLGAKVARTRVRAEQIVEILQDTPDVGDRPGARPAPALRGALRFDGVSFSYLDGHPVLHEVTFDARPGQVVALVGPTGAGKTTLASLVARLYDPTAGRVLLDGTDIRQFTLATLQPQVSYVLQEAVLFRASVADNIAYGRPGASRADIEAAARAACAHDFITALPDGYDTVVGERGATLSGGQRQRVAIARAIVRDAPVLVLDEPTTGLDARAERHVLDALDRLMEGRTTLAIAHRLATIRRADLIVLVDDGRVVEQGSHDELLAAGGRYAELWRLQVGDDAPPPAPAAPTPARPVPRSHQEAPVPDPVPGSASDRDTLDDATVRALERAYQVGTWTAWRRTPKGSSNTSFFVATTSGEYVLRRSNPRKTLASMELEARLVEHLAAQGYPAPRLVRPATGGHLQHQGRYYLLTARIPGRHYDPANPRHLHQAGAALARYHQLARSLAGPVIAAPGAGWRGLGGRARASFEPFARLAERRLDHLAHAALRQALARMQDHAGRVETTLDGVIDELPQVLIQGSFGRSALLFGGDELVGVVDYDRAGLDLRAIDLAYTIKAFCRLAGGRWVGLDEGLVRSFLDAYEALEPLGAAERDALPEVFQAQRLLKVIKKCENVVAKDLVVGQEAKDVEKVAAVLDRELDRLAWLRDNAPRLRVALDR